MELVEVTSEPVEFGTLVVDKVACEEDGVTLLGVDKVNDTTHIALVSIAHGANVQIRELGNAIAVKLLRQIREVECLLVNNVVVASDEIAERE